MTTKVVLRVENVAGEGMYCSTPGWSTLIGTTIKCDEWPGPEDDDGLKDHFTGWGAPLFGGWGDMRFGFSGPNQLRRWICDEHRKLLHGGGYHVSVYEVPEDSVIIGDRQAVFDKEHASLVRTHPLTDIDRVEVDQDQPQFAFWPSP